MPAHDEVILSTSHLAQWREEIARIDSQIAALSEQRSKLSQMLELAGAFISKVGEVSGHQLARSSTPRHDDLALKRQAELERAVRDISQDSTWIGAVRSVVAPLDFGVTGFDLKAAFKSVPLWEERINKSDKGFFHGLSRLVKRGEIKRYNGRYYNPSALEIFTKQVASGEVEDKMPVVPVHSPMEEAIRGILYAHPGVTSSDIIRKLKINPEFKAILTPHVTGAYNVLARMKKRKQIEARATRLFLTQ